MDTFPILTFTPQFKSVLWGGKRISQFKRITPQGDNIGESWELSGVPGHESTVAAGPYKGKNLHEMLLEHGKEILGDKLVKRYGNEFPLLIKFIDSADDLSIQVHPDDALAQKRHHCPGKTEMWISIDPTEQAYLYSGLNRALTSEEYRQRIKDNTILECLNKYYPQKGDIFFLPAGRIHSIGKGNFVLEIQETSDITYRIYDYNRRDSNGCPRQLHVEESIEAVDFNDLAGSAPTTVPAAGNTEHILADCSHFTTTAINVNGQFTIDLEKRASFTVIVAVNGHAPIIDAEGRVTMLPQGSTALIPASMPRVTIRGNCQVVTTYIK